MTDTERLLEQGRMLEERREIKTKLACLENKARRMEVALKRAGVSVRQSHIGNWRVDSNTGAIELNAPEYERSTEGPVPYPTLDELSAFLVERQRLESRMKELQELLSL